MKTISIVCPKGGVGKTSIAAALAVRASKDFPRVAMIDLNRDQANFTQFWQLRGEPDNPRLFSDHENLVIDLPLLAEDGWDICIIDTPPSYLDVIDTAVMVANAAIIPVKCSIFDAGSIGPIVEMCRRRRVPYAFLLNDLDQRFKTLISQVTASLKDDGPVLKSQVSHLQSYIVAPNMGKTGAEIDRKAAEEIDALWSEVKALAGITKRKGARA
jgi:chromosome partitioning protein